MTVLLVTTVRWVYMIDRPTKINPLFSVRKIEKRKRVAARFVVIHKQHTAVGTQAARTVREISRNKRRRFVL